MSALRARLAAIPSWQLTFGGALLAVGFLVAVQLRTEAPRVRYGTQERPLLVQAVLDLQARQETLKARIVELRTQVATAEATAAGNEADLRQLNAELAQARLAAGLVTVQGPGVVLGLSDSTQPVPPDGVADDYIVSADDLRDAVNELWLAGAEVVAVNGERVTVTTSVADLGVSVLVNNAFLQAPYEVSAIGPPDLQERLTMSAGFRRLLDERVDAFGIGVSLTSHPDLVVPAFAGSVRAAELSEPGASPGPAPSPGESAP